MGVNYPLEGLRYQNKKHPDSFFPVMYSCNRELLLLVFISLLKPNKSFVCANSRKQRINCEL